MLPAPRAYQNEADLARMCDLLQRGRAADISTYYVHTGDLKWWLYYPPIGGSWWEHIYLWDDPADGSRLLGWALIDPRGETFDVFCKPELAGSALNLEMLAWGEQAAETCARAADNKQVGIFWVIPEDSFKTCWLEERGYSIRYQSVAFARSLAEPIPPPVLPDGFQVRSCRGLEEVESRARAQYAAFESEARIDQYNERFARFMQSPAYDPDADVVATAPDGTIAAFAVHWVDPVNQAGLFEPVGTHPAYQRRGLGRAVMYEALRRLQAQGMLQAILTTGEHNDPAVLLYETVGFCRRTHFRFYAKDLA